MYLMSADRCRSLVLAFFGPFPSSMFFGVTSGGKENENLGAQTPAERGSRMSTLPGLHVHAGLSYFHFLLLLLETNYQIISCLPFMCCS